MSHRLPNAAPARLLLAASLALAALCSPAADAQSILFVGNSFTYGGYDPAMHYNTGAVNDLDGSGMGGVPGIFKKMADEAGLNYSVSMEAVGGQSLQFHYVNKLGLIGSQRFDAVVLQDYSTLDMNNPGNPSELYLYSHQLEQFVHGTDSANANPNANPAAKIYLLSTWPRADQVYNTPNGHWNGTSIEKMGADLRAAYNAAALLDAKIDGVNPVGDAFLLAVHAGVADGDPYDGIDAGKINLWNTDSYHASAWGSYLEALTIFGRLTGLDPRSLGAGDQAASGLGVSADQAVVLQNIAYRQLGVAPAVPESLRNQDSGHCLEAPGSTDGTLAATAKCKKGVSQSWLHRADGSLLAQGKCLDIPGTSTQPGIAVEAWTCNGGANQQWRFNADGSIASVLSGLCLAPSGATVVTQACNGSTSQRWSNRVLAAEASTLVGVQSLRCVDAPAAAASTPLRIADCNGGAGQRWTRKPNGSVHAQGGCLGVAGTPAAGAAVVLGKCTGGASTWRFADGGNVVDVSSGLCLDVTGGASANGSALELWSCQGGTNQSWMTSH